MDIFSYSFSLLYICINTFFIRTFLKEFSPYGFNNCPNNLIAEGQ